MSTEPTLAEVLTEILDSRLASVHTAFPGKILSYDSATQTATVRPQLRKWVQSAQDEDQDVAVTLPDLPSVPVVQPHAGGMFLHLTPSAGDGVLVVCLERDPSQYEISGAVSDATDRRLHSPAHAVAILGYGPRADAIPTPGDDLEFGADAGLRVNVNSTRMAVGGTADAAALASKLDAIGQAIAVIAAATDPASTQAAVNAVVTAFKLSYPTALNSCASSKLKLGG